MTSKSFHSLTRTALLGALVLSLGAGCDLLRSAATGEDIESDDIVSAAEDEHSERQQRQEDIEDTVTAIDETLEGIEDQRRGGNFWAAEVREDRLENLLDTLEDLDSSHAMLDSAPAELERIQSEFTREEYERRALADECEGNVDSARESRMNENWRWVDRQLTDYVQCRRRYIDQADDGGAALTDADDTYQEEIESYSEYLLEQIEDQRQADRFDLANSTERTLLNHIEYFEEVHGEQDLIADVDSTLEELHETYRDPAVVEAEQAEEAFYVWKDRAEGIFNDDIETIKSAEEEARPTFEEAEELMEDGDYDAALAKLEDARKTLYDAAYPSGVAMETAVTNGTLQRGLSYEIAAAIAEIRFRQGDRSKMYPELAIIKDGRPWLDDELELHAHLHQILADRDGDMVPQPTQEVHNYAGRFSNTADEFRAANERASVRAGESYSMLGVNLDPRSANSILHNPEDASGDVIYLEETVDGVGGGRITFDFRQTRQVAHNCRNTNEVASTNVYTGEVRYRQECDYRDVETGYEMSAAAPSGVQIRSGDTVELYGTVGSVVGEDTIRINNPGVVRVTRDGETVWYLGVDFD